MGIKSTHHEAALNQRFDELWLMFQTVVTWDELYLWYGVQKVAAGTYRDLLERWESYVAERGEDSDDFPLTVYFKRQQSILAAVIRRDFHEEDQHAELKVLARR